MTKQMVSYAENDNDIEVTIKIRKNRDIGFPTKRIPASIFFLYIPPSRKQPIIPVSANNSIKALCAA